MINHKNILGLPKMYLNSNCPPASGKAQGVGDEGATAANNELIEVGWMWIYDDLWVHLQGSA